MRRPILSTSSVLADKAFERDPRARAAFACSSIRASRAVPIPYYGKITLASPAPSRDRQDIDDGRACAAHESFLSQ